MQAKNEITLFSEHTPPNLEQLFGYESCNRWVAFFWGNIINHRAAGYCFDGKIFNPLNGLAWDTFFGHPLMVAMNHCRIKGHAVRRFDFGDMLQTSRHFLLLDRSKRSLHAAQRPFALNHLKMEIVSTNRGYALAKILHSHISRKSEGQISPYSKGALQMIADMTAWLDDRKLFLEKTGRWPH
jgi:hypothetical protein